VTAVQIYECDTQFSQIFSKFFNSLATVTFRHFAVKRRTSRSYVSLRVAHKEREYLSLKIPRYENVMVQLVCNLLQRTHKELICFFPRI
jgi:hypothetical protein